MKYSILITLCFFSLVAAMAQSKQGEVVIKTSARCGMCKETIERYMAFEKGVKQATVNLEDKTVTVKYSPKKTNPDKIRKAVTMSGYDADGLPADPKAYENLAPCCKKDSEEHTD